MLQTAYVHRLHSKPTQMLRTAAHLTFCNDCATSITGSLKALARCAWAHAIWGAGYVTPAHAHHAVQPEACCERSLAQHQGRAQPHQTLNARRVRDTKFLQLANCIATAGHGARGAARLEQVPCYEIPFSFGGKVVSYGLLCLYNSF